MSLPGMMESHYAQEDERVRSLGPLLLDEAARWGRTTPTDAQRAEAGLAPVIRSNAQRAEAGFAPAIRSEADRLAAGREPRAARLRLGASRR